MGIAARCFMGLGDLLIRLSRPNRHPHGRKQVSQREERSYEVLRARRHYRTQRKPRRTRAYAPRFPFLPSEVCVLRNNHRLKYLPTLAAPAPKKSHVRGRYAPSVKYPNISCAGSMSPYHGASKSSLESFPQSSAEWVIGLRPTDPCSIGWLLTILAGAVQTHGCRLRRLPWPFPSQVGRRRDWWALSWCRILPGYAVYAEAGRGFFRLRVRVVLGARVLSLR